MKLFKDTAHLILGVWLLLLSIQTLFHISSTFISRLLPVLAIIVAVLLFLGVIKLAKGAGTLLLAVWLLLRGLDYFLSLPIPYFGELMSLLALVAGILIIVRK